MDISSQELGGGVVVRLKGRLDAEAAEELRTVLAAVVDTGAPRVIVDVAGVDFLGSAGVRVFLSAYKEIQAAGRFLELIRPAPLVRKVLQVVGLDELLPPGRDTMHILDVLKQRSPHNDQALRNARRFLGELFDTLRIDSQRAARAVDDVFLICRTAETASEIEAELRGLLADMSLGDHIRQTREDRSAAVYRQIGPYVGPGSLLDLGCDAAGPDQSRLAVCLYDGLGIDSPDKAFEYTLLVNVLHCCEDPLRALREVMRLTRRRIVVTESVYLNEPHRRFTVFFDWFYNRVLRDDGRVGCSFNSPEGWEHLFQEEGLAVAASVDIGLDQATVPEYHWMYVLDLPDRG
jgi:anti-anti-sigma factor